MIKNLLVLTITALTCICNASLVGKNVTIKATPNFKIVGSEKAMFQINPFHKILEKEYPQYDAMGMKHLCRISTSKMNLTVRDLVEQLSAGFGTQLGMLSDSITSTAINPNKIWLLPSKEGIITLIITETDVSDVFDISCSYISNKAN